MEKTKLIIRIFRPARWYQNLLMLLGSFAALRISTTPATSLLPEIVIAFLALCLITSGNYGVNEVADADFDRFHPKKKFRGVASGLISKKLVLAVSAALYLLGIALVLSLSNHLLLVASILMIISGILYNVPPIRAKDIPYLDFTFEALNNPIRLLVGWYAITAALVPVSLLLVFWFVGVFLMAAKRFGEIRYIGDKISAPLYRKSFGYYTEKKLLFAMIAGISASMFMFGALTVKHSLNLIILLPFVIVFIVWFFLLSYEEDSMIKDPERIFEQKSFLLFSILLIVAFMVLTQIPDTFLSFLRN